MRGQRKNPRKAVQPFENKKRKIDIFKNYEANGVEKIQRKLEIFSTLISKKSIEFHNLVNKYQSDKGAKGLTTWSQFIAMLFCQLTGADSLREISDGLYSSLGKLSHIGATAVCRSTLSYANSKRPYKLYEDFYYVLLEKFRHEIQARTPQAKSYLEPEVCHWSND